MNKECFDVEICIDEATGEEYDQLTIKVGDSMNEVKTYYLSQEEIAKYDHIKPQNKEFYIKPRFGEREPLINKERYLEYKEQGYTDKEIIKDLHTSYSSLSKWKQKWGLKK